MTVVPDELEAVTEVCRAHIEVITKACRRAPLPPQPKRETQAIVRERREARSAAMRSQDRVGHSEVRANPVHEAIYYYLRAADGEENGYLCNRQVGISHLSTAECITLVTHQKYYASEITVIQ